MLFLSILIKDSYANLESEFKWEENESTGQEVTEWFTETCLTCQLWN